MHTTMPPHNYSTYKSSPLVIPAENFDAKADAAALEAALETKVGLICCDEDTIVNILGHRSLNQRLTIASAFHDLNGKDLVEDLKSSLHRHFEDVVVSMMKPLPQYFADELHRAMKGPGTDECTIVEILLSLSNHGLQEVATEYNNEYGVSLEEDLKSDTSGEFRNLLCKLCLANRDESDVVNEEAVREDALALADAGSSQWASDESIFSAVLATRSFPHLRLTFRVFQSISGRDIEAVISHDFSGDLRKGFLSIVRVVRNRAAFFAHRLHTAMKGAGTDDPTLIRIIVSRSEIDLGDIKQEFFATYGKSLESWINGDTSGHYKKMLLALICA